MKHGKTYRTREKSWPRSPSTPSPAASSATYWALDAKGLAYEIRDLSEDPAALEYVKSLGHLQAPVVVTDEDHWAGFRPDKINELGERAA